MLKNVENDQLQPGGKTLARTLLAIASGIAWVHHSHQQNKGGVGQDSGSLQCLIPVREVSQQRTCCQFACILRGKDASGNHEQTEFLKKLSPATHFLQLPSHLFQNHCIPRSFLPFTRPLPNKSTQGPSASFKGDPGEELGIFEPCPSGPGDVCTLTLGP